MNAISLAHVVGRSRTHSPLLRSGGPSDRNTCEGIILLLGLLLVGPAMAQTVEDPQQEAAPADKPRVAEVKNYALTLTGTAIDRNGKPVPGATIFLVATVGSPGKALGKVTTGDDGRFEFREVQLPVQVPTEKDTFESGDFQIFGKAPGYGFAWCGRKFLYTDPRYRTSDGQLSRAQQATGYLPGDEIDLNLAFMPAKTISGRLVDESSRPIENVKLRFFSCDEQDMTNNAQQDPRKFLAIRQAVELMPDDLAAISNAEGRFTFESVPSGMLCAITLEHPDYGRKTFYTATSGNRPKVTDSAQEVLPLPIEMTLRKARTISVQVTSEITKETVAGARVSALVQRVGGNSSGGVTDAQGRVTLKLPSGEYRLTTDPPNSTKENLIRTSQRLTVRDAADEQAIDVQLQRGCVVIFKVRDAGSGKGIPGVTFRYEPEGVRGRRPVYTHNWVSDSPKTNDDGEMRAVFAPGKHKFYVEFGQNLKEYLRDPLAAAGVETQLTPAEPTVVEVRLRRID